MFILFCFGFVHGDDLSVVKFPAILFFGAEAYAQNAQYAIIRIKSCSRIPAEARTCVFQKAQKCHGGQFENQENRLPPTQNWHSSVILDFLVLFESIGFLKLQENAPKNGNTVTNCCYFDIYCPSIVR